MKRILPLFCLLALLLAGCAAQPAATAIDAAPTAPAQTAPDEQQLLVGVWRNEGQYTEGREFVETMTLDQGGICTVHLEYQGQDYQTITGVYFVLNGVFSVSMADENGSYERVYQYTLDGDTLTLVNDSKTVTYLRVGAE